MAISQELRHGRREESSLADASDLVVREKWTFLTAHSKGEFDAEFESRPKSDPGIPSIYDIGDDQMGEENESKNACEKGRSAYIKQNLTPKLQGSDVETNKETTLRQEFGMKSRVPWTAPCTLEELPALDVWSAPSTLDDLPALPQNMSACSTVDELPGLPLLSATCTLDELPILEEDVDTGYDAPVQSGPAQHDAVVRKDQVASHCQHEARLLAAVAAGDTQAVEDALEDVAADGVRQSMFFHAVMKAREPRVLRVLLESGVDILAADSKGNSVMHFWARSTAAKPNLKLIGECLIDAGADVNSQRCADGMSPLHHVVIGHNNRRGWLDFHKALFLLRRGASLTSTTNKGQVPLDLLQRDRRSSTIMMIKLLSAPDLASRLSCGNRGCAWCSLPQLNAPGYCGQCA
jgi:hypothetical protein